jgi:hypothetical protein
MILGRVLISFLVVMRVSPSSKLKALLVLTVVLAALPLPCPDLKAEISGTNDIVARNITTRARNRSAYIQPAWPGKSSSSESK